MPPVTVHVSSDADAKKWSALVVVPARDEATRLGACLGVLHVSLVAWGGRFHVVVVDDASGDGTGVVARDGLTAMGERGMIVQGVGSTAGRARAVGVEQAREHWRLDPARTWVLSTDADSVVPVDWVSRHLAHARGGTVAVAGVVDLRDDADARAVRSLWENDYLPTLRVDGSHPHVHAANLGVRLDAYLAVGGFRDVARAEDIDLWRRLRADGHVPVADGDVVVATSARLRGRVEAGFAGALRRLLDDAVAS